MLSQASSSATPTLAETAPIVLFVYNRPEHTRRTLESLRANPEAPSSTLLVYADGAKGESDRAAVEAVRAVVRERAWCGEVQLIDSPANRGLAANILDGVTKTLERYDRAIVLEDDLELSPGFLAFMNRGLELYKDEPSVMTISGFLPELGLELPETLFLRTSGSWGWATWTRAWRHLRTDAKALAQEIRGRGLLREFNLDGGYDYFEQLRLNAEGRLRTWAILWYASIFLQNGLSLHPGRSLVRNIGHDGSGTHSQQDARFETPALPTGVKVEQMPVAPHDETRAAMRRRYRGTLLERAQRGMTQFVYRCRRLKSKAMRLARR